MAGLAPLRPDGRITAAVASQISDGAGGAADRLAGTHCALDGLTPLARVQTGRGWVPIRC